MFNRRSRKSLFAGKMKLDLSTLHCVQKSISVSKKKLTLLSSTSLQEASCFSCSKIYPLQPCSQLIYQLQWIITPYMKPLVSVLVEYIPFLPAGSLLQHCTSCSGPSLLSESISHPQTGGLSTNPLPPPSPLIGQSGHTLTLTSAPLACTVLHQAIMSQWRAGSNAPLVCKAGLQLPLLAWGGCHGRGRIIKLSHLDLYPRLNSLSLGTC